MSCVYVEIERGVLRYQFGYGRRRHRYTDQVHGIEMALFWGKWTNLKHKPCGTEADSGLLHPCTSTNGWLFWLPDWIPGRYPKSLKVKNNNHVPNIV